MAGSEDAATRNSKLMGDIADDLRSRDVSRLAASLRRATIIRLKDEERIGSDFLELCSVLEEKRPNEHCIGTYTLIIHYLNMNGRSDLAQRIEREGAEIKKLVEESGSGASGQATKEQTDPFSLDAVAEVPYDQRSLDQWERKKKLGAGGFGEVCAYVRQGKVVAVKRLRLAGDDPEKQAMNAKKEVNVWIELKSPNIVKYLWYEVKINPQEAVLSLCMELMKGGDMRQLAKAELPMEQSRVKRFLEQILRAVAYLHDPVRNIAHRDIKGSNVMLDDEKRVAKLGDFGLAVVVASDIREAAGTPHFVAPEVVRSATNNEPFDGKKADMWSVGATLVEMLTGRAPYEHLSGQDYLRKLQDPQLDMSRGYDLPSDFRAIFTPLVESCFNRDPTERPTAKDMFFTVCNV